MTVCTFYAQLGNFWEITKITSFWGNSWRFLAGKKLPASVENKNIKEKKRKERKKYKERKQGIKDVKVDIFSNKS